MRNKRWIGGVAIMVFFGVGIIEPTILLAGERERNNLGFKLEYIGPGDIQIKNMPFEVRNVPNHPDDTYAPARNAGPVGKLEYDTRGGTFILGPVGYVNFRNFRLGFGLNWMIVLTEDDRRNYTNNVGSSQRGYGAALTYVSFGKYGIIPPTKERFLGEYLLNITPEVSVEVYLDKKQNFSIGSSLSYFHLQAVNGWDRYDSLKPNQYYSLGHYLPLAVYVKYRWFVGGISYPIEIQKSSLGNEADVKANLTFFLGIKY